MLQMGERVLQFGQLLYGKLRAPTPPHQPVDASLLVSDAFMKLADFNR